MKTRRLISICVCMIWTIFASAYDFSEKNEDGVMLYYTNLEAGFCEVAQGPDNYEGKLVIPEIANGRIVVGLGVRAFQHTGLKSIVLPNTILYISPLAFEECYYLKTVDLGNSLMYIGEMAFGGCFSLDELKIPESLEYCGYFAFSACGIERPLYNSHYFLYFPRGYAENYTIPEGIETIGVSAFSGTTRLKSVTFPKSLKRIEEYAFDASSLTSLNLPSSLTSIGDNAFGQCHHLRTSVTIPASVTEMGEYIFYASDIKGCEFQNSFEKLPNGTFASCSELKEVHLPENLKAIGEYAFAGDKKLTKYNLPERLDSIGRRAFWECKSIKSFIVPEGVKRLEELTICECENLKSITLPSTLEYIGAWAIMDCAIESITLPESLSSIDLSALGHNKALKDVYVSWKEPITDLDDPFDNSFSSAWDAPYAATLHVPKGTKELYASAPVWKDFQNIVEDVSTDIPTYQIASKPEKVFSDGKVMIIKNNQFHDASSGIKIIRK